MEYKPSQMEYIKSVDGQAHNSAVEIIGRLEDDKHAGFGKEVMKWIKDNAVWEHEFGDELLEIAAKYKLASKVKYIKKIHSGVDDEVDDWVDDWLEEGDEIWWINDPK